MNKSEIAEKAAREIWCMQAGFPLAELPETLDRIELSEIELFKGIVERAIAESQAQPRTKPNFAESAEVLLRHLAQATGEPTKQAIAEDALYRMWIGQRVDDYGELGDGEPSPHIPLLEFDGRNIVGLKRCKKCGLSETYWERFPVCESGAAQEVSPPSPECESNSITLGAYCKHGNSYCILCFAESKEGVAAPLEPTLDAAKQIARKIIFLYVPDDTAKYYNVEQDITEMLMRYAAAVSKNLQERADYWKGRAEAAWEREENAFGKTFESVKRILELEKEIAALRETKP